ncbi:MAG: hypothetical protein JOZ68_02325 [Acidimicrobiia bacterium]|nr:hypothetical protein [Acidimicrobiia bacterium]MBV8985353.1 hypothetical protein [Acidimicrobiia bacterium]MBV9039811.1 hypothetical protein [Acidimicrobiia bacterium]
MDLKAGARLRSATDETEVIVVRAPSEPVDLRCGGHPMVAAEGDAGPKEAVEAGFDEGTQLGKRYADEEVGIEILCTKPGKASLSLGDERLNIKGAKPLPSSD